MGTIVQWRRGTTGAIAAYTPAQGEVVVDNTLKTLVVGDGVTLGGNYLLGAASAQAMSNKIITNSALDSTAIGQITPAAVASSTLRVNGGDIINALVSGTFVPTLLGSTGAGTPTYTAQLGYYFKIGKYCYINLAVGLSGLVGATGDITIGGLPFASINGGPVVAGEINVCVNTGTNITFSAGYTYLTGQIGSTLITTMGIAQNGSTKNNLTLPVSGYAGGAVTFSAFGFYMTNS